jgi:isoprenylcysteine carboxyl methyltransferase (ICMT) family protein YpbQ
MLITFVVFAFLFRIATVMLSIRNQRSLNQAGAVEYGVRNSNILALAHVLFFLSATIEAALHQPPFDTISIIGLALYGISVISIVFVIRLLGRLWTVRLLIAPDHSLVRHPLFRIVRHPNYYLNILPELIGIALVLHAYRTLLIGLPLYLIPLVTRMRQEEAVMRQNFTDY